jgi:3-deoxy-manno-octulosonate cytidylyltransferase (CMP-KDO synthetase)
MNVSIVIPARFNSSRYKGKPLVKILGREMILRVADICAKVLDKKNIFIATDSKKISKIVSTAGYNFLMTSKKCLTGTDRVAEAAKKIKSKIIINVQGDEPAIEPRDILKVIKNKIQNPKHVICGYNSIQSYENPMSKNIPKVVLNSKNELIYISRSLIPGSKKIDKKEKYLKQVCIYGFNKNQLNKFWKRKKKSILENKEDIEILRFFELNIKIKMTKLTSTSIAVDKIQDVKKAEKLLKKRYG